MPMPAGPETVEVAVLRRPATDTARRVGTLLVLPAGSGSNLVPLLGLILPTETLARFDVVLFDPPGIRSTPALSCGRLPGHHWEDLLDTPMDLGSAYERVARACAGDAIFESIDSGQLALDLTHLVSALGTEKVSILTLWGTSNAAAQFAAAHPEQVSAVIYDSPTGGAGTAAATRAIASGALLEQELEGFFGRCAARGPNCPMGPSPSATWDQLVTRILAEPRPGGTGPESLSLVQLQIAARMALMFPAIFEVQLAQGIVDALNGDATTLHAIVDDYANRLPEEGISAYVWNWALRCHDATPEPATLDNWAEATVRLATEFPRMGSLAANDHIWACMLGIEGRDIRLPELTPATVADPPPTLVLSSAHDVATPADWSRDFAVRLPAAVEVTRAGLGSTWSFNRSECTDSVMTAFLVDHETPSDRNICGQD
jgi:pimeloyl-ACP methyl ester carboxylesterase